MFKKLEALRDYFDFFIKYLDASWTIRIFTNLFHLHILIRFTSNADIREGFSKTLNPNSYENIYEEWDSFSNSDSENELVTTRTINEDYSNGYSDFLLFILLEFNRLIDTISTDNDFSMISYLITTFLSLFKPQKILDENLSKVHTCSSFAKWELIFKIFRLFFYFLISYTNLIWKLSRFRLCELRWKYVPNLLVLIQNRNISLNYFNWVFSEQKLRFVYSLFIYTVF